MIAKRVLEGTGEEISRYTKEHPAGRFRLIVLLGGDQQIWRALVRSHQVLGKQVHDAYQVAAMIAYGIGHVLTLDYRDFRRYSEIVAIHPIDVQ